MAHVPGTRTHRHTQTHVHTHAHVQIHVQTHKCGTCGRPPVCVLGRWRFPFMAGAGMCYGAVASFAVGRSRHRVMAGTGMCQLPVPAFDFGRCWHLSGLCFRRWASTLHPNMRGMIWHQQRSFRVWGHACGGSRSCGQAKVTMRSTTQEEYHNESPVCSSGFDFLAPFGCKEPCRAVPRQRMVAGFA